MMIQENFHAKQQGAALVVALIILLVMTILGVSTMSTATMELRMAANDRFSENAFQLAETGLDSVMAGINAGTVAIPAATAANCNAPMAQVWVPMLSGTYQSTLCFLGDIPDLTSGSSFGKVRGYHFVNNTQGVAQSQASSLNNLGMRVLGPDGS